MQKSLLRICTLPSVNREVRRNFDPSLLFLLLLLSHPLLCPTYIPAPLLLLAYPLAVLFSYFPAQCLALGDLVLRIWYSWFYSLLNKHSVHNDLDYLRCPHAHSITPLSLQQLLSSSPKEFTTSYYHFNPTIQTQRTVGTWDMAKSHSLFLGLRGEGGRGRKAENHWAR